MIEASLVLQVFLFLFCEPICFRWGSLLYRRRCSYKTVLLLSLDLLLCNNRNFRLIQKISYTRWPSSSLYFSALLLNYQSFVFYFLFTFLQLYLLFHLLNDQLLISYLLFKLINLRLWITNKRFVCSQLHFRS